MGKSVEKTYERLRELVSEKGIVVETASALRERSTAGFFLGCKSMLTEDLSEVLFVSLKTSKPGSNARTYKVGDKVIGVE